MDTKEVPTSATRSRLAEPNRDIDCTTLAFAESHNSAATLLCKLHNGSLGYTGTGTHTLPLCSEEADPGGKATRSRLMPPSPAGSSNARPRSPLLAPRLAVCSAASPRGVGAATAPRAGGAAEGPTYVGPTEGKGQCPHPDLERSPPEFPPPPAALGALPARGARRRESTPAAVDMPPPPTLIAAGDDESAGG